MNLVRERVTPAIGDVEGAPRSLQEREAISSSPMAGATQSLAMHIRAQKGRTKIWACVAVSLKDGYIEETWFEESQPEQSNPSLKKKRSMKAMKKKRSMKAMKKKPSMKAMKIKPSMKAMKIKAFKA